VKKKALIWRGGLAIGDALFTTPVARLLSDQYDVHVATRGKTDEIWTGNPYVKGQEHFSEMNTPEEVDSWLDKTFAGYDKIIRLAFTVEKKFLHRTDGIFGDIPDMEARRKAAQGRNYYDSNLQAAGLEPQVVLPELYATPKEEENLERIREEKKRQGMRLVLWNIMGSTSNKVLAPAFEWIKAVHEADKEVQHFIVGANPILSPSMPENNPKIIDKSGAWTLRLALFMTGIADLVIGPESAIVNAAGCWDTPKIIFYSHSDPDNLGRYYLNHYPIRPKCDCHPCYLIPINFRKQWEKQKRFMCRTMEAACIERSPDHHARILGYRCVETLDREEIIETAVSILRKGETSAKKHLAMA
jgi:ADP-heptose:LPS heptosyltransferase